MLPNHSPLVIAEQFGTLESLYPGRIDLGLGRAPGTDPRTVRALRRDPSAADSFPEDVLELQALLAPAKSGQPVRAVPGPGPRFRFGSWDRVRSAPNSLRRSDCLTPSLHTSRPTLCSLRSISTANEFKPSKQLDHPYAMVGVNVVAADTDEEARRLFTTVQQSFTNLVRGTRANCKRRSTTSKSTGLRRKSIRLRTC